MLFNILVNLTIRFHKLKRDHHVFPFFQDFAFKLLVSYLGSLFFLFVSCFSWLHHWHVGSKSRPGSNPRPLYWQHGVLTAGPSREVPWAYSPAYQSSSGASLLSQICVMLTARFCWAEQAPPQKTLPTHNSALLPTPGFFSKGLQLASNAWSSAPVFPVSLVYSEVLVSETCMVPIHHWPGQQFRGRELPTTALTSWASIPNQHHSG